MNMLPSEIDGWILSDSTETYNRQTIFDYMDGAGEVYLAYNFRELVIKRLERKDKPEIIIEFFDMVNPDDAYGVFSHNRESEKTGIGGGYEQRGGLVCFWKDRYFICVSTHEPSDDIEDIILKTARAIANNIEPNPLPPAIINMIPRENLISETIRYFHLMSSLNYHYFISEENILNLGKKTNVVMANYEPGFTYYILIEYPDSSAAAKSRRNFEAKYLNQIMSDEDSDDTKKRSSCRTVDNYLVIVLDAYDEATENKLKILYNK